MAKKRRKTKLIRAQKLLETHSDDDEPRKSRTSIYVSTDVLETFQEICHGKGRSISAVLEEVMKDLIEIYR